jgi:hypothetical protein
MPKDGCNLLRTSSVDRHWFDGDIWVLYSEFMRSKDREARLGAVGAPDTVLRKTLQPRL